MPHYDLTPLSKSVYSSSVLPFSSSEKDMVGSCMSLLCGRCFCGGGDKEGAGGRLLGEESSEELDTSSN